MAFRSRIRPLVGILVVVLLIPIGVVASHGFQDVPDSNVFHQDIEWLANADVTRGCNPPINNRFCPEDPVTRQEMAAFMHRLATNRVVDAELLEGFTADELRSSGEFETYRVAEEGLVEEGAFSSVSAACETGDILLGGGYDTFWPGPESYHIISTGPDADANEWTVVATHDGLGDLPITVYALCGDTG